MTFVDGDQIAENTILVLEHGSPPSKKDKFSAAARTYSVTDYYHAERQPNRTRQTQNTNLYSCNVTDLHRIFPGHCCTRRRPKPLCRTSACPDSSSSEHRCNRRCEANESVTHSHTAMTW